MIDIEVRRAWHDRTIKIYARNKDQPPVTVTVRKEDMHLYSHADMTHEDWLLLSIRVANVITEMKRQNNEASDDTPSDS